MTLQEWGKLKVGNNIINIRSNNIYIIIVKHLNFGSPNYYVQKCNTEIRMFVYNATEWKLLTDVDKVKLL